LLGDVFGVTFEGEGEALGYIAPSPAVWAGLPDMVRLVQGTWLRVTPARDARRLAELVRARFADDGLLRIGHGWPPARECSGWPALVGHQFGGGQVVYSPMPLFGDYAALPDEEQRRFLGNLLELTAPLAERPLVTRRLPPSAEVSLMRLDQAWVVHILPGEGLRVPDLNGVEVLVRPDFEPRRAYLAPQGEDMDYAPEAGGIAVRIPRVVGHTMLVVE
jgi:hypothetical protein